MKIEQLGKVGIIFDGGAFNGIYQIGSAKAILKRGIKPQYMQGVSVGALNAAKLVETGSIHELEKVWYYVEKRGPGILFNPREPAFRIIQKKNSLYSDSGLDHILSHLEHPEKITQSNIRLDVVAHNLYNNNKYTVFSNTEWRFRNKPELFVKAVKASASIPGIFPPVEIEGDFYSDGLLFSISWAINAGCNTIFVLSLRHSHQDLDPNKSHLFRRLMIPFNTVLDQENASTVAKFKNHPLANSPFRIIEVMIKDRCDAIRPDDFPKNGGEFRKAIRLAYDQTNQILDKLKIK